VLNSFEECMIVERNLKVVVFVYTITKKFNALPVLLYLKTIHNRTCARVIVTQLLSTVLTGSNALATWCCYFRIIEIFWNVIWNKYPCLKFNLSYSSPFWIFQFYKLFCIVLYVFDLMNVSLGCYSHLLWNQIPFNEDKMQ
jgi:hypothetical protein